VPDGFAQFRQETLKKHGKALQSEIPDVQELDRLLLAIYGFCEALADKAFRELDIPQ